MYRSLLDAVDVTGDDRYGSGRTQIFYFNKGLFSNFSRGTRGLDLNAVLADLDNTHTRIGRVNETDLSEIFNMMQGEVWSPNGEANTMPAMSKTGHTSMSMGDVIMLPNGSVYMVDFSGFTNLNDGSKKMASRNVTASDRSALIKLASSLPSGSPERKAILAGLEGSSNKKASGVPGVHIKNQTGKKVNIEQFIQGFSDESPNLMMLGPLMTVSKWADAMKAAQVEEYNGFVLDEVVSLLKRLGVDTVHPAREFSVAVYFPVPDRVANAKAELIKLFTIGKTSCDEFTTIATKPNGFILDVAGYSKRPYSATADQISAGNIVWVRMWWD